MRRNGRQPGAAHPAPVYPPALAHEVERRARVGEAACEACGDAYDPQFEGQAPTTWRLALCERCFQLGGRQAA